MTTEDEWKLIRLCRAGNAAHFEPLVREHEPRALAIAQALLGDADDAADAVQDAFFRAYRGLERLKEGSAFGPWFRTILRNLCMDRLRSNRHRSQPWSMEAIDRAAWAEPAAPRDLERSQLSDAVRDALGAISPEHREILVLKELEGLSYAEVAAAAGIPVGTVASRLHHARLALKKVLVARGISLEEVG